ncbi:DUF6049 family protein [Cnuibacter sp. UC19_7]|uniref:DUF6049 family protein n=1 Tax=Cnuibacter sp. UC19_7 TaxID=3350166 RepID=UPI00366FE5C2
MHEARRSPRVAPAIAAAALVAGAVFATPGVALADTTPTPVPSATASPTPLNDGTVSIQVSPSANGVVTPGTPYTVQVQVTNGTTSPLPSGAVEVELDRDRLADDAALTAWLNPSDGTAETTVPIGSAPMPAVPSGSTHSVTMTIDPTAFGLTDWGAYGVAAEVSVSGEVEASSRTAVVWNQGAAPAADPVTLVAPITVPAVTTGLISSDDLKTYTASDGVLTALLDAYADRPVALAIDPRIIASIRALGTKAPDSAVAWLKRLSDASNDTFALQYGDADLSAQAQAGLSAPLTPTSFAWALDPDDFASGSVPTTEQLLAWDYTTTGVAWPRDGTVVSTDLGVYQAAGLGTPLIGSSQLTDSTGGEYAGSTALVGETPVLVSDRAASVAARGAVGDSDDVTRGQSLADLSAALAVDAQRSATTGDRGTLIVLDRDSTRPTATDRLFSALETAPWAGTSDFSDLADSVSRASASATLVDAAESPERIQQVQAVLATLPPLDTFSSILEDPQLIQGRARAVALSTLANAWADQPDAFAEAASGVVGASTKTLQSVQIVDGSSITMVSNQSELPITLANDLPYPVNVVLHAVPSNGRLVVGQTDTAVTLEASSRKSVKIPLQAQVANGQVLLRLDLLAPDGTVLSSPPARQVTVSADWETVGTAVAGGLVVVLFGIGISREVIKRRRRRALASSEGQGAE